MTAPSPKLVLDIFAGGGGASTGIRSALGIEPAIALNHCPAALAMHMANHPSTLHYEHDVTLTNPRALTQDRPVALIWFSPDCTHHSRAKGGKPLDKKNRALADEIPRWLRELRPEMGILENVVEFLDWCDLDENGRPIAAEKGKLFRAWVRECEALGYRVEWRVLCAADYGSPTWRRRLFIILKRTPGPIVWPEPTHGPGLLPYRTAAECIDWSIPCRSIFGRERPLKPATLRRIARGVMKYVVNNPRPFIVPITHQGDARCYSVDEPLRTITCASRGEFSLVAPFIVPRYGERPTQDPRCQPADEPMSTIVPTQNGAQLVAAFLAQHNTGVTGHPADRPLSTITSTGSHQQLVAANLLKLRHHSDGQGCEEPLHTIAAGGQHFGLVAAFLQKYYGTGAAAPVDEPLDTVTTNDRFSLVTVPIEGYGDFVLADILTRMFTPRELACAQGFDPSYCLDPIFRGKPLTKTAQVRCIGNSVCPQVAEALVRANVRLDTPYVLPGWSGFRRLPARVAGQGELW